MDTIDPDRSAWFADGFAEELREFLLTHGAVEYLSFLSQEPRRFAEMQEELSIGDGTLNELNARAEALQLRVIGQQKRDGTYYRVHQLTPIGKVVAEQMQRKGVTQLHERLRIVRQEYEQAREDYIGWVEDSEEFLENIESYLERIQSYDPPDSTNLSTPSEEISDYDLGEADVDDSDESDSSKGANDSNG